MLVLNELKTGYDMRPQSFLGSFGRTAQNANKSFKNATNSSIITGFLKTDPELQHVCVFGTLTASFNRWLAAVRNVFAVSPNDP